MWMVWVVLKNPKAKRWAAYVWRCVSQTHVVEMHVGVRLWDHAAEILQASVPA